MAAANKIFYHVTVSTLELNTVGNYCRDINSPAFQYSQIETEFLNIIDESGVTNRQRLYNTYTAQQLLDYANFLDKDLPLQIGVRFAVPTDKVDRNGLLTQGLLVVSNSDVAFKANALAEIESDPTYVSVTKPIKGQILKGTTVESVPEETVWIWSRVLNQVFDITAFVSNLTTNVTKGSGGNFSISLPPLICSLDASGNWGITEGNITQYVNSQDTSLAGQGYVAEGSIYDVNLNRNQFLFHNIISPNDIVLIRFETLQLEKSSRFSQQDTFYINTQQIPGKVYDMIGLVDLNGISVSPTANDVSITITGRDLSKLFIEDGSYYYTLEQNDGRVFGAGQSNSGLVKRIVSETGTSFFELWYSQSIERVFEFVIEQISNIKICPDTLFQFYDKFSTNKRSTKFDSGNVFKTKQRDQFIQEYYQNAIDSITALRLANGLNLSDNSSENNQVIVIFNALSSFLQAIRDNNVRVSTDNNLTQTWSAFTWVYAQPPLAPANYPVTDGQLPTYFNGQLYDPNTMLSGLLLPNQNFLDDILQNIDSWLNVNNSKGKFQEPYKEVLASGIWQIVKLVVDKGIANRRINDPSISTASGSLLNFFNKVVQEPFVEMILDTYSDIYAITLRKPPTDQIGLISLLEGKILTEDGKVTNGTPVVIDIEQEDVIKEDLYFDDKDIYSWYHLTPECDWINNDAFSYAYLPALYFPEYADIWGSKPMDLSHKYMPQIPLDSNTNDLDLSQKQAVNDLKFMIDSNMHNPFTRKGTLIVNGDRRVKVGNIIRYKPTGEIFTIDAVQQSFKIGESMIDRTTVIHVSRGMVEQLIYGIPYVNSQNQEVDYIGYFNIINTKTVFKYNTTPQTTTTLVQQGTKPQKSSVITIPESRYPINTLDFLSSANQGIDKLGEFPYAQQQLFQQLITAINQLTLNGHNIYVNITSGVRTYEQQVIEYNKNSSTVHNAKPGTSPHELSNGALAIDINLFTVVGGAKYSYQPININKQSLPGIWLNTGVPQLAKKLGFLWGGDAFKGYYDPVHFQIVPTSSAVVQVPNMVPVTTTTLVKTLDTAAIFSNFKTNQHVFDFFFGKKQFDPKYNSGTINRKLYNSDTQKAIG